MNYVAVTAHIPVDLIPQFYRWVADVHDGTATTSQIPLHVFAPSGVADDRTPFPEADPELIRTWWAKLSDTARGMIAFLAHNAEERFTGTELADECGTLAGPSGAAGTFNWPSRFAKSMGFVGPWDWDIEKGAYFMSAADAAVLLSAVGPGDK